MLSLLTLCLTAALHAQDAPVPAQAPGASVGGRPAPEPQAIVSTAPKTAKDLLLESSPLKDVVQRMEDSIEAFRGPSGEAATMPNVIFGPGTQELVMSANLRIRDVTPVQALTLVATAAGCALEPIASPAEPDGSARTGEKIIGYQFTLAPARVMSYGMSGYGNTTLRQPVLKSVPAEPLYATATAPPAPESATRPSPLARTTTTLAKPGAATAGSFPVADSTKASGATPQTPAAAFAETAMGGISFIAPGHPAAEPPGVRVYALGALMRGGTTEMKEQQENLQALLAEALDHAKLDGDGPKLSFHIASKALIVRGTAAQHDIITQVITALKENEDAGQKNF